MRVISGLVAALRRHGADEHGFSLITVMGLLLVSSMFAAAAFAASNNDIPLAGKNQDSKKAYAAAEAGLNYYLFRLNQDNAYWTKCDTDTSVSPNPVTQPWTSASDAGRPMRAVPGSASEMYTIELLPVPAALQSAIPGAPFTTCQTSSTNSQVSMINPTTGALQIRSTGFSHGVKRSIVATLRRKGFLDFLYYTKLETTDPVLYGSNIPSGCDPTIFRRNGRQGCQEIQFAAGDKVNGPLHTEDDLLICGGATFGRSLADHIEILGNAPNGYSNGNCAANPNKVGTFVVPAGTIDLPPSVSNTTLQQVALPQYTFTGVTWIKLNQGGTMDITTTNQSTGATTTTTGVAWPSNGVIYVKQGTCGTGYKVTQDYQYANGCAEVYVSGTYSQSLTIASEQDIIVNGNVLRDPATNSTLGLIPQNFVRVYHPVPSGCGNAAVPLGNVEIDAAILSLTDSFMVDNFFCGGPQGTLTVRGAIAQKYRGAVGNSNSDGSVANGYVKSYWYDDRLKIQTPPYFLDPAKTSWNVVRYTEQIPAH